MGQYVRPDARPLAGKDGSGTSGKIQTFNNSRKVEVTGDWSVTGGHHAFIRCCHPFRLCVQAGDDESEPLPLQRPPPGAEPDDDDGEKVRE